jgi:hypothetical protein
LLAVLSDGGNSSNEQVLPELENLHKCSGWENLRGQRLSKAHHGAGANMPYRLCNGSLFRRHLDGFLERPILACFGFARGGVSHAAHTPPTRQHYAVVEVRNWGCVALCWNCAIISPLPTGGAEMTKRMQVAARDTSRCGLTKYFEMIPPP